MPANLTPQYLKAENEYRRALTAEERVNCLEEMIRLIPKHKGTDRLQGELRAKLKEAKAEAQVEKSAPKKTRGFRFPVQGAGQAILLGGPNAGKSRVMAELTNATPLVADYPYSTHEPSPAMMSWEDVTVQLLDTPPISDTHMEPYMTNLVRAADVAVLCFDGSSDDAPEQTQEVLKQLAARKTLLSDRTGFDEEDMAVVHVKTLLVATRGLDPDCDARLEFFRELCPEVKLETLKTDLDQPEDRETLRNRIYRLLNVIRVYTKRPGKPAEYKDPFTIPAGGTVEELALKVHADLAESLKFAKVWGQSAHDGQSVGRDHQLLDRDLVELH